MKIEDSWTFNSCDTAQAFDSHVREQLPWYSMVTDAVATIARAYLRTGGLVYDIGASTGNVGRAISGLLSSRQGRLIAIEPSQQMASKYQGPGDLHIIDACDVDTFERFDVAICMLSLMFMPMTRRRSLFAKLEAARNPDGCIVVVDKFATTQGNMANIARHITLRAKLASGVDMESIAKKELSLLGVQVPLQEGEIPRDCYEFFRFGEFAGYVMPMTAGGGA